MKWPLRVWSQGQNGLWSSDPVTQHDIDRRAYVELKYAEYARISPRNTFTPKTVQITPKKGA